MSSAIGVAIAVVILGLIVVGTVWGTWSVMSSRRYPRQQVQRQNDFLSNDGQVDAVTGEER